MYFNIVRNAINFKRRTVSRMSLLPLLLNICLHVPYLLLQYQKTKLGRVLSYKYIT